ncbi:leucine--tRNA ligase, partial [Desulfobacteraceae bacterium SEEP-SAG9]
APPERDLEWSERGVEGSFRFLNRVWRLAAACMDPIKDVTSFDRASDRIEGEELKDLYKKTHQTIQRVTRDIEDRFHFNTAISAIMELVNTMSAMEQENKTAD